MNKENMVYIMEYYPTIKKENEILSFAVKWMEMEDIMSNEVSHMFSLTVGTKINN